MEHPFRCRERKGATCLAQRSVLRMQGIEMRTPFRMSLGAMALAFATASSAAIVYREPPPIQYELQSYSNTSTSPEPLSSPSNATTSPVSAIHSGGETLDDTLIAENVARAFADDPRLDGATITVSARNGDVSLSGSSRSAEQGAYAQELARRVSGVRSVSGTLSAGGG